MQLAKRLTLVITICMVVFACSDEKQEQTTPQLENPVNKTQDHLHQFYGLELNDPYHWLTETDSDEVINWRQQQTDLSNSFFAGDNFEQFKQQLAEQNTANYLFPQVYRQNYYFIRQAIDSDGNLDPDSKAESIATNWQLFIFNAVSKQQQTIELPITNSSEIVALRIAPKARYAAYQIKDIQGNYQWQVYDISARSNLQTSLPINSKPSSFEWFSSTKYIYSNGATIYWANLFQPQIKAQPVFGLAQDDKAEDIDSSSDPSSDQSSDQSSDKSSEQSSKENPSEGQAALKAQFSSEHRFIVIEQAASDGGGSQVWLQPLGSDAEPTALVSNIKASFQYLANKQDDFYFLTNLSAGRNRIISINLNKPSRRFWREIVPQDKGLLVSAQLLDNKWLLAYKNNGKLELAQSNLNGSGKKIIDSDSLGELVFYLQNLFSQTPVLFNYHSLVNPSIAYQFNANNNSFESVFGDLKKANNIDSLGIKQQDIEQQLHFYRSQDGSRIPLELIKLASYSDKKSLPTLLVTHQGFGQEFSYRYHFLISNFIATGGQVAIAHIRGGGLYGQSWYRAGAADNKNKAVEDLVAAQEWLLDKNLSSREQSALLANDLNAYLFANLLNYDATLFSVAILDAQHLNLLDETLLETLAWQQELGFKQNNKTAKQLLALSPYQNMKTSAYPATLLLLDENNLNAWKFLARMQNHQSQQKPIIVAKKATTGIEASDFNNAAKALYFLQQNLGLAIK